MLSQNHLLHIFQPARSPTWPLPVDAGLIKSSSESKQELPLELHRVRKPNQCVLDIYYWTLSNPFLSQGSGP